MALQLVRQPSLAEVVPQRMRERRQWVAWALNKDGRKIPYVVGGRGRPARTNDPPTWRDFSEALAYFAGKRPPSTGIGYVFNEADGLVFIDFDDALVDPDVASLLGDGPALLPWAAPLVEPFIGRAYIEVSPSGRGLHVFALGSVERSHAELVPPGVVGKGHVEIYKTLRYSTVTGEVFAGSAQLGDAQEAIDALLGALEAPQKRKPSPPKASADNHEEPERAGEAAEALAHLDPDLLYGDWLRVGMALRAGLGAAGRDLWLEWSARGGKHQRGEPEAKWETFGREPGQPRVGLGTLFSMAKEAGWERKRPDPAEDFTPLGADTEAIPYHQERTGKSIVYVRGAKNVALYFERDGAWRGRLRWNLRDDAAELDGKLVADADLVDLGDAVSRAFGWSPAVAKDTLRDGVARAARTDEFDPVREWLAGLRWDGTARLGSLPARLGLEDNDATRRYVRRWMIGAVARAFRPGCEMQTMLVLAGPQGSRKSRLFKRLAVRPEWYRESEVRLADKDGQLAVLAPWIVEVGELAGMSKAEVDRVKVFVSESESRFRRPYGQLDERHPRRCVFGGTTNDEQFTRDQTGARRFWAVGLATEELSLPEPEEVAQLWAEARVAFQAGERWWEDGAELRETLERGEERRVETTLDVEVERIAEELTNVRATTMREVVAILRDRRALSGGNTPTPTIAHALKRAGWQLRRTRLDGRPRRVWVLPRADREAEVLAFRRAAGFTEEFQEKGAPDGDAHQ